MSNAAKAEIVRYRLADIQRAVQCLLSENGTTREQDELLFGTGFVDELCNARTTCGFTVNIRRCADGSVSGNVPVRLWLEHFQENDTVFVKGIGSVFIASPTEDELIDEELATELGTNALYFLPKWGQDAVRAEFVRRTYGVKTDDLPPAGGLQGTPTAEDMVCELLNAEVPNPEDGNYRPL